MTIQPVTEAGRALPGFSEKRPGLWGLDLNQRPLGHEGKTSPKANQLTPTKPTKTDFLPFKVWADL